MRENDKQRKPVFEVITFGGTEDHLVWKSPAEDFNTQSQVVVPQSQEAVFFRSGEMMDSLGPGRHQLSTGNLPGLRRLLNIGTGGQTAFTAQVFFVNKTLTVEMKWGTPNQFLFRDPELQRTMHAGANGTLMVQIANARKFLEKVSGTRAEFKAQDLMEYCRAQVIQQATEQLAIVMNQIPFTSINMHLVDISNAIGQRLTASMGELGVGLRQFAIRAVVVDEKDYQAITEAEDYRATDCIRLEADKRRMDTLGYTWSDEKIAQILSTYAKNEGGGASLGGMAGQIPLGMMMGQTLGQQMEPLLSGAGFSGHGKAFGQNVPPEQPPAQQAHGRFCPACGKGVPAGAKFCMECGQAMPNDTCAKCGAKLSQGAKFCMECGQARGDGA